MYHHHHHHHPLLDPVLFASSCGEVGANPPSTTAAISNEATLDLRLASISAAVEFSKNNNLLGVLLDTYLLVCPLSLYEGSIPFFATPHPGQGAVAGSCRTRCWTVDCRIWHRGEPRKSRFINSKCRWWRSGRSLPRGRPGLPPTDMVLGDAVIVTIYANALSLQGVIEGLY